MALLIVCAVGSFSLGLVRRVKTFVALLVAALGAWLALFLVHAHDVSAEAGPGIGGGMVFGLGLLGLAAGVVTFVAGLGIGHVTRKRHWNDKGQ